MRIRKYDPLLMMVIGFANFGLGVWLDRSWMLLLGVLALVYAVFMAVQYDKKAAR